VGVSTNRSADFKAQSKVHANKAEIGGWDANRIVSHLCKPGPKLEEPDELSPNPIPKRTRKRHAHSPSGDAYTKHLMTN